jgi:hypothetical protein
MHVPHHIYLVCGMLPSCLAKYSKIIWDAMFKDDIRLMGSTVLEPLSLLNVIGVSSHNFGEILSHPNILVSCPASKDISDMRGADGLCSQWVACLVTCLVPCWTQWCSHFRGDNPWLKWSIFIKIDSVYFSMLIMWLGYFGWFSPCFHAVLHMLF